MGDRIGRAVRPPELRERTPAALRWLPGAGLALRPGGSWAPLKMSAARARAMFSDLDGETAQRLAARLVPEAPGFLTSPMPGPGLPAGLPVTYLLAREDRIHRPRRQAAVAARLGAAVIEIGSGHDPMLSQPGAVAAIINQIAAGRLPRMARWPLSPVNGRADPPARGRS